MARRAGAEGIDRTRAPVPATCADRLERLAHGAELGGADVVGGGPGPVAGAQARVGQIVGVHELVPVVAAVEHEHRSALGHQLEEDRHEAEPAVAEDGAGPDDRDVEPVGGGLPAQRLRLELGPAVGLQRPGRRLLVDRVLRRGCRRWRWSRCAPPWRRRRPRAASSTWAVPVTFTDQNSARSLRERHLGDVVEHHVDPAQAARTASRSRTSATMLSAAESEGLRSRTRTSSPWARHARRGSSRSSRSHR